MCESGDGVRSAETWHRAGKLSAPRSGPPVIGLASVIVVFGKLNDPRCSQDIPAEFTAGNQMGASSPHIRRKLFIKVTGFQ
jgi:hypothetical protein